MNHILIMVLLIVFGIILGGVFMYSSIKKTFNPQSNSLDISGQGNSSGSTIALTVRFAIKLLIFVGLLLLPFFLVRLIG